MKSKRIAALQCSTLFGSLTADALADVAQRAIELHLRKGEMLFLSGERAKGLLVIVEGKIRVFQQNEDGREQVMHVNLAGSVLGDVPVFDDGPFPASAIAEVETVVLLIEKDEVRELCAKYPALALAALKLMATKVRRHSDLVEALSLHEVGQRLAHFLLAESQSAASGSNAPTTFQLHLSNQQIASRIGSVRDVVSRTLTRLKDKGLIALHDREVTILNLQALEHYAASAHSSGGTSRSDSDRRVPPSKVNPPGNSV